MPQMEVLGLIYLTGEKINSILTKALENDVRIGGVKVVTENRWFTAPPSRTEGIYEIYVESFFEWRSSEKYYR